MPPPLATITTAKFRAFYSKTKDLTSVSLSGLHLGHWKAASASQELSEILLSIINLVILNSYSLKRWLQVVGLLQEKDKGLPYIHRFRTLHIVESELNYVMRLIWGKELMFWANDHHAINDN